MIERAEHAKRKSLWDFRLIMEPAPKVPLKLWGQDSFCPNLLTAA